MGCQSNAKLARLKKFQHGRTKKPTVEDVLESEDEEYCPPAQKQMSNPLDEGIFFLDEEPLAYDDSDSEFEDDEVEEDELKELYRAILGDSKVSLSQQPKDE